MPCWCCLEACQRPSAMQCPCMASLFVSCPIPSAPPRPARSTKRTVGLPEQAGEGGSYFESSGVEKAVLLARYTDMLEGW